MIRDEESRNAHGEPLTAAHHEVLRESISHVEMLATSPDAAMRRSRLVDALRDATPRQAAWLLEGLIRGALHRHTACLRLYDAILVAPHLVLARLESEGLEALLEAACSEPCMAAQIWLHAEELGENQLREREAKGEQPRVAFVLREMTLGARRSLARRASGDTIGLLAVDPDPGVVLNLLRNPRMSEAMVLRLVSHRPAAAEALQSVLQVERWRQRYRIRFALARNPYLGIAVGVRLLPSLLRRDLEALQADENLSATLRSAAAKLLVLDGPLAKPLEHC